MLTNLEEKGPVVGTLEPNGRFHRLAVRFAEGADALSDAVAASRVR